MSLARLVITAVAVAGRTKADRRPRLRHHPVLRTDSGQGSKAEARRRSSRTPGGRTATRGDSPEVEGRVVRLPEQLSLLALVAGEMLRDDAEMKTVRQLERANVLIGREVELLGLTKRAQSGQIVYLHGLAGIGKSALLNHFVQQSQASGSSVIALDCRAIEPTDRGFLQAVNGFDDLEAFVEYLTTLVPPVVLVLDHYEVFRLMDTWTRQTLVPLLPAGVGLVLACRERPVAGW